MPTIVLAVPAGRRASFAPALTQFTFFAAASVPTPFRAFHQARWGFSPAVLTPVFAVYALAPPVALLTTGSLSDRLGLGAGALASGGIALFAGDPTRSVFLAALFPGSGVIVVLSHSAAGSSPGSNRRRSPG